MTDRKLPLVTSLMDAPGATPGTESSRVLVDRPGLRIEQIISLDHASEEGFWYDQDEFEWVAVLTGFGVIEFEDGSTARLGPGDALEIPPHTRHRVASTDPSVPTVWLAVHGAPD